MEIIRIKKTFRNGEKLHYLIVDIDNDDYVRDQVENWAENDSSGQIYGYNLVWEKETNIDIILEVITNEIKSTGWRIKTLEEYKDRLNDFYQLINNKEK